MRVAPAVCGYGLFFLLLGGCADNVKDRQAVYVVQPQDTLYSIAWRHDLDFHDLARWNHIGSDFRISVGQLLRLSPAPPVAGKAPGSPAIESPFQWNWPTDRIGAPRPVPGGGILLTGRLGQDVRASSPGRVVYNGAGIRGYGNLIIIKHDDTWLSAYAHNRESLVREGQQVAGGQVIGHMGEGAPRSPTLYFEIRQNGKPVDPIALLPITK